MIGVRAIVVAVLASAIATAVAFAASLGVSSERLTVYTSTSQLPTIDCTLTASADSYVDELSGLLSSNFGTATTLHVQSLALADKRTFVRFDLASCAIPSTATVKSAKLRLTFTQAPSASRTYNVHRPTADWTETGITWSNQPAVDSAGATASASVGSSSTLVEWDVAADVAKFVGGTATNYGWRVRDANEDAVLAVEGRFAAREHATVDARPKLVVRYQK